MLERFLFDVLDGSVAGNLSVVNSPKGPQMRFSTEFAGLDLEELIPKRARKGKSSAPAQSEIDGNMEVEFQIQPGSESETISIDQIAVKIAVTRIGAETLDRALLFLDPDESKPAIADIRSKLKLASPHRILITMANGNLNLEAWLKNKVLGTILKAPELKRIPISSLKRFKLISEPLQALAGLGDVLKYFAARGIEFNEEKKITLY